MIPCERVSRVSISKPIIDRRRVLRGAGGIALGAAIGAPLAACSTGSDTKNTADTNAKVVLPTYQASKLVEPDLAPTAEGVLPGFLAYPKDPVTAVEEPPGKGGSLAALTYTFDPIAPALPDNAFWRDVNKALNVDLKLNYVRDADYANRFATTLAGGDLPDMVLVRPPQPNLPQLLASQFQDLSEHLSGDAVKKYPSLAALPTISWRSVIYNGGVYGIPVPRALIGAVLFARLDIIESKGLPAKPANYQEFVQLLTGLTDSKKNQWAAAVASQLLAAVKAMLHIPAAWGEKGGKFTHAAESEKYTQALENVTGLVKQGVVHPDGAVSNNNQRNAWFTNGTISLSSSGYAGWFKYLDWGKDIPGYKIDGLIIPGYDGGKALQAPGAVHAGFLALRKADKPKIEEILRVLNWLATPFGSKEFLLRRYGQQGTHHTLSGTDPVLNDVGKRETITPIRYVADSESVIYEPGNTESTRAQHAYQKEVIPTVGLDPTIGLFSNTLATKGSQLQKMLDDTQADIFAGRKPVSVWAETVTQWKQQGGDAIRAEFEEDFTRTR